MGREMEKFRTTLGFLAQAAGYTLVAMTELREWGGGRESCIWIWTSAG